MRRKGRLMVTYVWAITRSESMNSLEEHTSQNYVRSLIFVHIRFEAIRVYCKMNA